MARDFLSKRKVVKKLYAKNGDDQNSQAHLCNRLANGLASADQDSCWEWTRTRNIFGYGTLRVNGKTVLAHRLSYELSRGEKIKPGMNICHKCDNPICINPGHLFLGTRSDNMKDCFKKGRSSVKPASFPGESNPMCKLSNLQVGEILELLRSGETQKNIAIRYGVSQSQIANIKKGKRKP